MNEKFRLEHVTCFLAQRQHGFQTLGSHNSVAAL
jgi:hypothetical protein